jgi:hypothetical protein
MHRSALHVVEVEGEGVAVNEVGFISTLTEFVFGRKEGDGASIIIFGRHGLAWTPEECGPLPVLDADRVLIDGLAGTSLFSAGVSGPMVVDLVGGADIVSLLLDLSKDVLVRAFGTLKIDALDHDFLTLLRVVLELFTLFIVQMAGSKLGFSVPLASENVACLLTTHILESVRKLGGGTGGQNCCGLESGHGYKRLKRQV